MDLCDLVSIIFSKRNEGFKSPYPVAYKSRLCSILSKLFVP